MFFLSKCKIFRNISTKQMLPNLSKCSRNLGEGRQFRMRVFRHSKTGISWRGFRQQDNFENLRRTVISKLISKMGISKNWLGTLFWPYKTFKWPNKTFKWPNKMFKWPNKTFKWPNKRFKWPNFQTSRLIRSFKHLIRSK